MRELVQQVRDVAFPGVPVYRGWPERDVLDRTIATKGAIVTISPRPNVFRNTTRYIDDVTTVAGAPPTFTATVAGTTATFVGTASPDQIAGVLIADIGYSVRLTSADTPSTVAARIAGLALGAASSGASVTAFRLTDARTGRDGASLRTVRHAEQGMMVCVWCATPELRDQIAGAIDAALSDVPFLRFADQSAGRIRSVGMFTSDKAENAGLFRRDGWWTCEYATVVHTSLTPLLWPDVRLRAGGTVQPSLSPAPTAPLAPSLPSIVTIATVHVIPA